MTKRRFNASCCSARQNQADRQGGPGNMAFSLDCPQNANINNFLTSRKNLSEKDSSGYYHKWLLAISFFVGKNNQTLHKSALDISRKEQTLRVNVDNISQQRFTSLEVGTWHPTGADQMSIGLHRSNKTTQLGSNEFLHESKKFQAELDQISKGEHRVAPNLPNPSQSFQMSKYAYVMIKREHWPNVSSSFHSRIKIYDNRFIWKIGQNASIGENDKLPQWHLMNSFLSDEFPMADFIGPPGFSKVNKTLLERLNAKCIFECRNLLHVPVDSEEQMNSFRTQEFTHSNQEYRELNQEKKPAFRASDQINSLVELEFNLKPRPVYSSTVLHPPSPLGGKE